MKTWKELDSQSPKPFIGQEGSSHDTYHILKICQIYLDEKKLSKEFDEFYMQFMFPETRKNKIRFEEGI
jgi:hypothetical protein